MGSIERILLEGLPGNQQEQRQPSASSTWDPATNAAAVGSGPAGRRGRAIALVPTRVKSGPPGEVAVLVHFHGLGGGLRNPGLDPTDVRHYRMPEQLENFLLTRPDARMIALLPIGISVGADRRGTGFTNTSFGNLNVDAFVTASFARLSGELPAGSTPGGVVLSAHSGGGLELSRMMRSGQSRLPRRLLGVFSFESIHADLPTWVAFVRSKLDSDLAQLRLRSEAAGSPTQIFAHQLAYLLTNDAGASGFRLVVMGAQRGNGSTYGSRALAVRRAIVEWFEHRHDELAQVTAGRAELLNALWMNYSATTSTGTHGAAMAGARQNLGRALANLPRTGALTGSAARRTRPASARPGAGAQSVTTGLRSEGATAATGAARGGNPPMPRDEPAIVHLIAGIVRALSQHENSDRIDESHMQTSAGPHASLASPLQGTAEWFVSALSRAPAAELLQYGIAPAELVDASRRMNSAGALWESAVRLETTPSPAELAASPLAIRAGFNEGDMQRLVTFVRLRRACVDALARWVQPPPPPRQQTQTRPPPPRQRTQSRRQAFVHSQEFLAIARGADATSLQIRPSTLSAMVSLPAWAEDKHGWMRLAVDRMPDPASTNGAPGESLGSRLSAAAVAGAGLAVAGARIEREVRRDLSRPELANEDAVTFMRRAARRHNANPQYQNDAEQHFRHLMQLNPLGQCHHHRLPMRTRPGPDMPSQYRLPVDDRPAQETAGASMPTRPAAPAPAAGTSAPPPPPSRSTAAPTVPRTTPPATTLPAGSSPAAAPPAHGGLNFSRAREVRIGSAVYHVFPLPDRQTRPRGERPLYVAQSVTGSLGGHPLAAAAVPAASALIEAMHRTGQATGDASLLNARVISGWRPTTRNEGVLFRDALRHHLIVLTRENPSLWTGLTLPADVLAMAEEQLVGQGRTHSVADLIALLGHSPGWTQEQASALVRHTQGNKAPRGGSPHHSGVVIDINFPAVTADGRGVQDHDARFERNNEARRSAAGVWLAENAEQFRFASYDTRKEIWHMEWLDWRQAGGR